MVYTKEFEEGLNEIFRTIKVKPIYEENWKFKKIKTEFQFPRKVDIEKDENVVKSIFIETNGTLRLIYTKEKGFRDRVIFESEEDKNKLKKFLEDNE